MAQNPVIDFVERQFNPDPVAAYDYNGLQGVPIVIDNGMHSVKVGFSVNDSPTLNFRSRVVRAKKPGTSAEILVGNDIPDHDGSKNTYRSLHDSGIVTNFGTMEEVLDHSFIKLGINTSSIEHPILMTEPVCNPHYCRQRMTELLLECYETPGVSYGIDGLFSFYHSAFTNNMDTQNGIAIASSHSATHVLPYINGKFDAGNAKRLAYGGNEMMEYLTQLTYLKYPFHRQSLHEKRMDQIQSQLYIAKDYDQELLNWDETKDNKIFQLPYVEPEAKVEDEEEKKRKRVEQGNRLREYMNQKRERVLLEQEQTLETLLAARNLPSEHKTKMRCKELGIELAELDPKIYKLKTSIAEKRHKLYGTPIEEIDEEPPAKKEYSFDLLDVSDSELNDEQKKEKKKQRFIKNAGEGRERAKKIRQQIQMEKEEEEKKLEKYRQENPQQYVAELNEKKKKLVRKRQLRKRKVDELQDRRSQASKQRMRLIMQQAQNVEDVKGKKNKARQKKKEDNFGMDDSQWDVYRNISKEEDSESEHEQEEINDLEQLIMKYDPNYKPDDEPLDAKHSAQVHLGTELIRAPEALFQPSLIGRDRAGLMETINWILKYYSSEQQALLAGNIHISGGVANLPGFTERLKFDLTKVRPFGSSIKVVRPRQPTLSAWMGAREWIVNERAQFDTSLLTRQDYLEHGADYLKEHGFSNFYHN